VVVLHGQFAQRRRGSDSASSWCFFRRGERREPAENHSAWRIDDVYLAHLALTDVDGKRFFSHERLNRAGPGLAGASLREAAHLEWKLVGAMEPGSADGRSHDRRVSIPSAARSGQAGGDSWRKRGEPKKRKARGKASHYVSFPRLAVAGELEVEGRPLRRQRDRLDGTTSGSPTNSDAIASRLGLVLASNLTTGGNLMLFQLRTRNGSIDPHSSGTYVDARGSARHLTARRISRSSRRVTG